MMRMDQLPSFRGQLAVVYNDYMHTLGGGERSALAYARALMDFGFETEILTRNQLPDRSRLRDTFGREFDEVSMRHVKARQLYSYLKPAGLMVFVNHTFLSFEPNPAKIGFYSQMFPERRVRRYEHKKEWSALQTYSALLCNSSFTQNYSKARWDFPTHKTHILIPPIASDLIAARNNFIASPPFKKKQFINLGRFNPGVHNKNQKVIIEAFLNAQQSDPHIKDWKLILCGNRNSDPASEEYYKECCNLAAQSAGSVEIKANLTAEELYQHLEASFGYVHGTGAFLPAGVSPEKCEHFGLAIAEAMAHGCIPLVYARGGIFDIFNPKEAGFAYSSNAQLIAGFQKIASLWGSPVHNKMQKANLLGIDNVSRAQFTQQLLGFIQGELSK